MIYHVVLAKFREDVDAAEIKAIVGGLAALTHRLEGFEKCRFGPNASPEGLNRGYGHAFVMEFADVAARDRYLVDAEHKRLGARLAAAAGGRDNILVFDLEVA